MRAALLLVFAATLTAAADGPKEDEVKEALKKLEGTWVVDSAVDSKEGIGSELGWEWVFAGDKVTRQNPRDGETQKFTGKVDPAVSPKALDLTREEDKFVFPCIYEVKGDTLRICISRAEQRPTEFTDEKGTAW